MLQAHEIRWWLIYVAVQSCCRREQGAKRSHLQENIKHLFPFVQTVLLQMDHESCADEETTVNMSDAASEGSVSYASYLVYSGVYENETVSETLWVYLWYDTSLCLCNLLECAKSICRSGSVNVMDIFEPKDKRKQATSHKHLSVHCGLFSR